MGGKGSTERPLAPMILQYHHVESQPPGASPRTYIQNLNGDRWTQTFGNLTFGFSDPDVTALTGEQVIPQRIVVTAHLIRLDSPDAVFGAIRELSRDLSIPDLGPSGWAYVFLYPKRQDFDQMLTAAKSAAIPGLQRFAPLTPQCSYARLHLDQGNRQAAILLAHVPDLTLSLDDAGDRTCIEQFFAKNLQLAPAQIQALLYPAGSKNVGGCTVARILRPDQMRAEPAMESDGCPTAPDRRAEALMAFAKAEGIGLKPGQAQAIIKSVTDSCKRQVESGGPLAGTCRPVLQ